MSKRPGQYTSPSPRRIACSSIAHALRAQPFQRGQRDRAVLMLERSGQLQFDLIQREAEPGVVEAMGRRM